MCYMALDEQTTDDKTLQIKTDKWTLDSGCSRHMSGNLNILKDIVYKDCGSVNFGDNSKGYVISLGNIDNSKTSNILLVKNLKHNMLSVNQLIRVSKLNS